MKSVIRIFALFVAFAGLASASLTPANNQNRVTRNSVTVNDPGPTILIPGPLPCQSTGECYAATPSSH